MSTRLPLILVALLALPGTASALSITGPAIPPAPGPDKVCAPAKGVVCGPAEALSLRAALAGYQRALRSNRVRRGLGLPSLRRLFGNAGPRAERLADARLGRGSAASGRAHAGKLSARAAGASALTRVGSVGRVRVEATAPGIGAGVDQIGYTDAIKGPNGSQTRSIRFTAAADACPVAASGGDNVGKDMGHLLAAEHIVTVQRTGHLEIKTDFTLDTTGTREVWGVVHRNSDLAEIMPSLSSTAHARIRRVRVTRDLRSGRRSREKPLELSYELHSISPLAMDGSGGFDRFIAQYGGANDSDPADAVVSDRLLNESAFKSAALTFMLAVGSKTHAVYASAEAQWKTPNRCVQVQSDAPQGLVPGQSIKVHVSATSKRGDPAANLRAYAHYAPYRSDGLTVDPFAFVEPDASAAHDFTVTALSQAWPDSSPLRLQVMLYSTAGIGEVDSDFKAQTLPIHYRVLSTSYVTHLHASQPAGTCAPFGGTSGSQTFSGASTGPVADGGSNTLDSGGHSTSGPWSGELFGRTDAKQSWHVSGCDSDASGQLRACSGGYTDAPTSWNVGFSIVVPNPASGEAKVHWMLLAPGIVDQQGTCGVNFVGAVPYEKTTQTVPLAKLLATDPQTFAYSDSIHLDTDGLGKPASIDYDWSFSITVQRQ
jgi:hypothetical protein